MFLHQFAISIVLVPLSILWSSFVFLKIWEWFVASYMEWTPSLIAVMGVFLLSSLFKSMPRSGDNDWETFIKSVVFHILGPAFVLFYAFLISLFI